jgi:hypothetical protein
MRAQECNRYIAINYSDPEPAWTIGVRTRTAGDPTGTMDYPVLGGPLGAGGSLFLHEYGMEPQRRAAGRMSDVYAERRYRARRRGDKRFHVKQIVFDADTANGIGFRFFPREQPQDAASEFDTGLYTEIHGGLMDVRFSGRSVRTRMEASRTSRSR